MPLTSAERKHRMPFGAQRAVSTEQRVDPGYVSRVMNDEVHPKTPPAQRKLRRVQVAISRKLGVTVDEAFPPAEQSAAA
jgi:hypothetical protein